MLKLPKVHQWFVEPLDSETNAAVSHMLADKGDADRHGHYEVSGKEVSLWEVTEDELRLILGNAFNTCRVYHIKRRGDDIKEFKTDILYRVGGRKKSSSSNTLVVWTGIPYQAVNKAIREHNLHDSEELWHRYAHIDHREYIKRVEGKDFSKILILGTGSLGDDHAQLIKAAQEHGVPVETRNEKARMFVARCAMGHAA